MRTRSYLEGGGAVRTRSYPARPRTTLPYVHTPETWAQSRAAVSHTHTTLRMRNTMVVKLKGWSVGSPLYGGSRGSGGGCWVLLPKDDASSFCLEGRFTRAAWLV